MDRPDTKADAVIALSTHLASCSEEGDTYLKQHDAPEDIGVLVWSSNDVQDCAWLAPLIGRWGRRDDDLMIVAVAATI